MTNPVIIDAAPGSSHVDIAREFEAPVEAVYAAHADPELFVQWIGPRGLENTLPHWDFRSGGGYAFDQRDADGSVYGFRGVFHTVVENELIIQTFEYLGTPNEVSLDIIRFESLPGGRSRLTSRSLFPSPEVLESMVAEGMGDGVTQGYEKLDELLKGR